MGSTPRGLCRRWKDTVYAPEFEHLQLQHFYRALDVLAEHRETIEDALWNRQRTLFNVRLTWVLWDTTSSSFEGSGPDAARFGHSKDNRPDPRQVVAGS